MSDALGVVHGAYGRVALLTMDSNLVKHAHPHCHVIFKIEGEDARFDVRGKISPLTDQQAVLVNAWEPHAYVHDGGVKTTTVLALYIEREWLSRLSASLGFSSKRHFFSQASGVITPAIRALAQDLSTSMVFAPDLLQEHEMLLERLTATVMQSFSDWRLSQPLAAQAGCLPRLDWRIRQAVKILHENPNANHNIDRLARVSGLSRAHFFRLFSQSTGVSPNVFFNTIRLESAITSILSTDDPLTVLSDRLGFSAPPHFSRFFRDHAGCTPSAFRMVTRLAAAA